MYYGFPRFSSSLQKFATTCAPTISSILRSDILPLSDGDKFRSPLNCQELILSRAETAPPCIRMAHRSKTLWCQLEIFEQFAIQNQSPSSHGVFELILS